MNNLGNSYFIGYTALRARQFEMETTSDNLANINTPGFKERKVLFQTALGVENDELYRAGVEMASAVSEFSQGALQVTDQPFDLAIDGDGFFAVQLPSGETAYTRRGLFHPDSQRRLVTEQGLSLVPPITVPEGVDQASIDAEGNVTAVQNGLPQVIGRLQLTVFPNAQGLNHLGDGLYLATATSGAPVATAPNQNGAGQVFSGAVEASNVDTSQQMVNILHVQRAYSLALRALQITDQMASITNQLQA